MATYTVTLSNWNSTSFWSGINEGSGGHTLDYSGLGSGFTVDHDVSGGTITFSDGSDTFVVGEASSGAGADAYLSGTTQLEYFDTIIGTDGSDTLQGGAGDDSIDGKKGDDTVYGNDGADTLIGNEGDDSVLGGKGDDYLAGNEGEDTLIGGDGNDTLQGSFDNDALYGGGGDDFLWGGYGDDTIYIENDFGNDTVEAEGVAETVGDTLDLTGVTDALRIDLTNAHSEIGTVSDGTSTLKFDEVEHIVLGAGVDTLVLADFSGSDTVQGFSAPTNNGDGTFSGNDFLDVTGITSDDLDSVNTGDVKVTEDADGNAVLTFPGLVVLTLEGVAASDVSSPAQLSAIGIPLAPGGPDYVVSGTGGDDLIDTGYSGDPEGDMIDNADHFDGTDADSVVAGTGDDTIVSGLGDDTVHGGAGNDSVQAGDGADSVVGGIGNDTVYGKDGADTLIGGEGDDSLFGEVGNDFVQGGIGDDHLEGNEGEDTLIGGDGNDWMRGSYDNDVLYGGGGDDFLWGGYGDDTIYIENDFGNDTVEAEGVAETVGDTLDLTAVTDALRIDLTNAHSEIGTVSDGTSTLQYDEVEHVVLGAGVDTLVLADFGGSDTVQGFSAPTDNGDGTFSGNDLVDVTGVTSDDLDSVNTSDVTVTEDAAGNAVLTFPGLVVLTLEGVAAADVSSPAQLNAIGIPLPAGASDYVVSGTSSDDLIDTGYTDDPEGDLVDNADHSDGSDDDSVVAGAGDDTIVAGHGDDTVHGGAGDDTFVADAELDNDSLIGGESDETLGDTADISAITDDLTVVFTAAETGSVTDGTSTTSFEEIESLSLGSGDDCVTGSAGGDNIAGNGGADTIDGGAGNDTIALGASDGEADTLAIGDGDGSDIVEDFEVPTDNGDGTFTGRDMLDVSELSDAGGDLIDTNDVAVSDTNGDGSGDAILTFPNGESVTLVGVAVTDLASPEQLAAIGIPLASTGSDYVVSGTGSDDLIDAAYTGDPDGDMIDNADHSDGTDDDSVEAGAGDDTIVAGNGNDTVHGGAGDDSIQTGAGDDTLLGDDGSDTLIGGIGDDDMDGGADEDFFSLSDGFGADTIYGGETVTTGVDFDTIDVTGLTAPTLVTLTGAESGTVTDGTSTATFTGIEAIAFGGGDDSVDASGIGIGIEVDGAGGADALTGGAGDDTLAGGADDDTLTGGAGDDILTGGAGNDELNVGSGDDAQGGGGDDTFNVSASDVNGGDLTIAGGETGETLGDTLNITGPATITMTGAEAGVVNWLDGSRLNFSEIEAVNYVPCFTQGTLIKTVRGEIDVADIMQGDLVLTRDNGYQTVRWAGSKTLAKAEIAARPKLQPIRIAKGALGNGLPERDLVVSPQHRIVMTGYSIQLLFGEDEVLVAATHLVGRPGITRDCPEAGVTYVHFMFDRHELVMSDGSWTESFQPGDLSLASLDMDQRDELLMLFPQLTSPLGRDGFGAARMSLKAYQARLLLEV